MHNVSILIVGANGFVGGHLLKKFYDMGHVGVRCLIRRPSEAVNQLCRDVRIGDLRDKNSIRDIAKNIDVVFHLATVGNINAVLPEEYEKYRLNNVTGTKNLLEECVKGGVKKFIYFSSLAVYGSAKGPLITESMTCKPETPYEKTKYECEKLVEKFCGKHEISFSILRPSAIYGRGGKSDIRRLAGFVKLGIIPIAGDGRNLVHVTHVDDVIDAAVKASKAGKSGIYILNSESLPLNEIIEIVGKGRRIIKLKIPVSAIREFLRVLEPVLGAMGIAPPISASRIERFSSARTYSIKLAEKELGFKPRRHLKSSVY